MIINWSQSARGRGIWDWSGALGPIVIPDQVGREFTLPTNRAHYTFSESLPHFTLSTNRAQFTLPNSLPHFTLPTNRPHFTLPEDDR